MRKTPRMIEQELRLKEPIQNYIRRGLNEGKTQTALARELCITKGVMRYWMLLLDIRKGYGDDGRASDVQQP